MQDYLIMHKDLIIAETSGYQINKIIHPEICPAMIKEGSDIRPWIETRSIDIHRSNSRRLYKALRLDLYGSTEEKINKGHAVTINDNWWVQRVDENCDYKSLKSYNKEIADVALYGNYIPEMDIEGYTELGTLGSYEKAWRKDGGIWYLYKNEGKAELLSEYFSSVFLKAMQVDVAEYRIIRYKAETGLEREYIISKDFTEAGKYDFEPFINYFGEDEDEGYIIERLQNLTDTIPTVIEDYVNMCFYDALLCNTDRHNGNVGFLRDSETGKILRLAPFFDYNVSLASSCKLHFNDKELGYMGYFTRSRIFMEYMEKLIPERNHLFDAVRLATSETEQAFPGTSETCALCGKYIMDSYDYFRRQYK